VTKKRGGTRQPYERKKKKKGLLKKGQWQSLTKAAKQKVPTLFQIRVCPQVNRVSSVKEEEEGAGKLKKKKVGRNS